MNIFSKVKLNNGSGNAWFGLGVFQGKKDGQEVENAVLTA